MANNLCTSSMILHKITPSLDYKQWLKQVSTLISKNLSTTIFKKSPKLWRQRIRKRYHKILGTSVINSPMSPSCLHIIIQQKYICLHLATTVFQDWILFACLSFWCFILKQQNFSIVLFVCPSVGNTIRKCDFLDCY